MLLFDVLLSMSTARAQVVADFDTTGLDWVGIQFTIGVPSAGGWSGNAGICTGDCVVESPYVLTTATRIAFIGVADEPGSAEFNGAHLEGPPGAWTPGEADTGGTCGLLLPLYFYSYPSVPDAEFAIDDLTWAGNPCPQYTDGDGDGLCPLGHDLDGDGACTAVNEAIEEGTSEPIDCDDTRPGAFCPIALDLDWTDTSPSIYPGGNEIPLGLVYVDETPICLAMSPGFLTYGHCAGVSSAFPVTHRTLTASMRSTGSVVEGGGVVQLGWAGDVVPGTTTLGVWEDFEADVGVECGRMASLEWDGYSFADEQATYELDGIALVGEVCEEYLDRDGDGACLAGNDIDGDGQCIGDGEAQSVDQIVDCDDAVFGSDCLKLTVSPVVADVWTVTATGAVPGESVVFAATTTLGSQCPPALGGRCFGLGSLHHHLMALADATGTATVSFTLPAAKPPYGTPIYAQAAVVRGTGGADSLLSNVGREFAR